MPLNSCLDKEDIFNPTVSSYKDIDQKNSTDIPTVFYLRNLDLPNVLFLVGRRRMGNPTVFTKKYFRYPCLCIL